MSFNENKIKDFLDVLASKESMPGGGTASALVAANGVSLALMVCNLTYGKEKYKDNDTISKPSKTLFEWDDKEQLKYKRKSEAKEDEIKTFYQTTYNTALYRLNMVDPISSLLNNKGWGCIRGVLYSSLLSSSIIYLIIPLILPNGKSLGKLAMKLVVLTDEGYRYQKWKLIIRYLSFYIIEIFGGILTISLTFVLSSCLAFFSKKHKSLHDYISFSVVADEKYSIFYNNEEEERKAIESINKKVE